jgi:hypothetical protein
MTHFCVGFFFYLPTSCHQYFEAREKIVIRRLQMSVTFL